MAFIVEMVRGMPDDPTFSTYSCGGAKWNELLSIAVAFGWVPTGTVHDPYAARRTQGYEKEFIPSYSPEEWAYCKRIDDADALGLASALKLAAATFREGNVVRIEQPSALHLRYDMTIEELEQANQMPSELLDGFARYAEAGGFSFAWDD